eukprot:907618-Prorocentrum_lima.AAC.1
MFSGAESNPNPSSCYGTQTRKNQHGLADLELMQDVPSDHWRRIMAPPMGWLFPCSSWMS